MAVAESYLEVDVVRHSGLTARLIPKSLCCCCRGESERSHNLIHRSRCGVR